VILVGAQKTRILVGMQTEKTVHDVSDGNVHFIGNLTKSHVYCVAKKNVYILYLFSDFLGD
jgi:hypothetical protein